MSALGNRVKSHWIVPALAAIGVAIAVTAAATTSDAAPNLPSKSAQDLLTEVLSAKPVPLSGEVDYQANVGLPDLGHTKASPLDLITGSGTMQVWVDPALGARANLKGQSSEFTTVATGADLWAYSSALNAAWHADISGSQASHRPSAALPTPQDAAKQLLQAVEPSTELSVDDTVRIAGRSAYQLVLTPRTTQTLIASVRIAVDADTSTPLRLQLWSTQDSAEPAWQIAFSAITFATPSAQTFAFAPPAGAKVTQLPITPDGHGHGDIGAPTISGQNWSTVVTFHGLGDLDVADLPGASATAPDAAHGARDLLPGHNGGGTDIGGLLDQWGTAVPQGTIYSSALLTVLVTHDGDVLVGAVPAETLQHAAQS